MSKVSQQINKYQLPDISEQQSRYVETPTNENFKALSIACAPYYFTQKSMNEGIKLLQSLPYSHQAYDWAIKQFHPNYQAKFIPEKIPTIIINGELDYITPTSLFMNENRWQRGNISIQSIGQAGHFPWLDNFERISLGLQALMDSIKY